MSAARPLLWGATGVALGGMGAASFAFPGQAADVSPWWSLPAFGIIGALFALVSRPTRWWVALGFAWLLAAWIEAGQAVWLPDTGRARIEDLVLGCAGGTLGVAIVVGTRMLVAHRRAVREASRPSPSVAAPSAAAAVPRTR